MQIKGCPKIDSLLARLIAGMMALSAVTAWGQSDDFEDGNDTGWTHVDLSSIGLPGSISSYTVLDDGLGGKAYRLMAFPPPSALGGDVGPARAFSYRSNDYTRFAVAVDIIYWDTTVDQAFGLLARVGPIGIGQTDGYAMNYNPDDGDLQINELAGESPTTIAEVTVPLDPVRSRYRWVFTGYNDTLVGHVFALPDTNNPVTAVVASDSQHASGKAGVVIFDRNDPPQYTNAVATFDNYSASAPDTGSLRATIVELAPRPKEEVRSIPPTVKVAILNRETDVNANSIELTVDGSVIPTANLTVTPEVLVPNNPNPFPGVAVSYPVTNLANLAGTHTNRIVFQDSTGLRQTNEWTFTYATLRGTNAAPTGTGTAPGFKVRLVQASVTTAENLARAEQQLGPNPPPNYAAFSTNVVATAINYTQKDTNAVGYVPDGYFDNESNFPGIDPSVQGDPNDMAMEILAYLELPAGVHTFGVRSDNGFKLSSGASFADPNPLVLGLKNSGTFDGTFDFVVEQAGLYPFRMAWFERGGGALVELFSVDRTTSERTLINDSSVSAAIKAFTSVSGPPSGVTILNPHFEATTFVLSFQSETGKTYTIESSGDLNSWGSAGVNPVPGTGSVLDVSIPAQTASRTFYRVREQ